MRPILPFLALLTLSGCDQIDAWRHPYDETQPLRTIPAPPSGDIAPYPGAAGLTLEGRPGPCATTPCYQFIKGRWKPLKDVSGVPLLSIDAATGSVYSDDLWRTVVTGREILINSEAGRQNSAKGQFDGLRIGLLAGNRTRYITAYVLDGSGAPSVYLSGGTAWLLQPRPDHSANLADLFALPATPVIACLPGLAIDQNAWAGPPEKALSPDIFVSRAVDPAAAKAEQAAVTHACASKPKAP